MKVIFNFNKGLSYHWLIGMTNLGSLTFLPHCRSVVN